MRNGIEINYSIAMMGHNIQQQIREDKITSSIDKQTELPQTLDQRSVFITSEVGQGEDTNVIGEINGRYNNNEQKSNFSTETERKENQGQLTRIINQQNNNMNVSNRRITTGLGSYTDLREPNKVNITQLLKRERDRNDSADLQEDARSGNPDPLRQQNNGKLNSTTDSLSKLCRSGDYSPKEAIIQIICMI
ncbi:MAG: hypothetical protein EZS28_038963 [Streblomastix strix]|uniref:Uncharacterized protein n=1 Tax=Streblomastix strix TaxID=222440 RepID=A0A5J4U6J8_9EUKA|nr:MAG: hypothetical protein EZS28_038963 [Streblomastix strix]